MKIAPKDFTPKQWSDFTILHTFFDNAPKSVRRAAKRLDSQDDEVVGGLAEMMLAGAQFETKS